MLPSIILKTNLPFLCRTDQAFETYIERLEGVDDADTDLLDLDPAILTAVLEYHVVDGSINATTAKANNGQPVTKHPESSDIIVDDFNEKVLVNDATVVKADVAADNGYYSCH